MKNTLRLTVGMMMVGLSLVAGGASAGTLGTNITIYDESSTKPLGQWYGPQEDQEVEPSTLAGQAWDLEGFFLDGNLSMVGGYDFVNGVLGHPATQAGDLFIDINGDIEYGALSHSNGNNYAPYQVVSDDFGYDFAVDLDFATMTFTVYDIRGTEGQSLQLLCDGENINDAANPWRYLGGGTQIASGTIDYYTGLANDDPMLAGYGLLGGSHNVVSLDLSWLAGILAEQGSYEFWTHFTMECGNDNLIGHNPGVPEPATISLLGLGLLGAVMRKKFWA